MGFTYIFWGILLAFFDFRLGGLDVLPDFIGFILIFHGANLLLHISDHFKTAGQYALPLIFLSTFDVYQKQQTSGIDVHFSLLWFLYSIIMAVLTIMLFYYICRGIEEKALGLRIEDLAIQARRRWFMVLVLEGVGICIPYTIIIAPMFASILFVFMFVYSIMVLILLMTLMKTARNQFLEPLHY